MVLDNARHLLNANSRRIFVNGMKINEIRLNILQYYIKTGKIEPRDSIISIPFAY